MLARGFSNSDIAEEICVSIATVKTHIYRIFKKTNIKNRTEAVSYLKGL
jgi:DNA-binding NarL/FixJ family response regulator